MLYCFVPSKLSAGQYRVYIMLYYTVNIVLLPHGHDRFTLQTSQTLVSQSLASSNICRAKQTHGSFCYFDVIFGQQPDSNQINAFVVSMVFGESSDQYLLSFCLRGTLYLPSPWKPICAAKF